MLTILLKNWRSILAIAGVIALVIAILLARHYRDKFLVEQSEKDNVLLINSEQFKEIELYRTKSDVLVAVNELAEVNNKTLQELVKTQEYNFITELRGVKKSLKNVEQLQKIQARVYDSLLVKIQNTDSLDVVTSSGDTIKIKPFKASYQDKYSRLSVQQISLDSAVFVHQDEVPLQGAIIWTRKWFLGKKHYQNQLSSPNPNVTISQLELIKVTKGKKR
jgi:hypothetical protein